MKKLLFILLIVFAGMICQAQMTKSDAYAIAREFKKLNSRIDSLEKRIVKIEEVHRGDSIELYERMHDPGGIWIDDEIIWDDGIYRDTTIGDSIIYHPLLKSKYIKPMK
jgi:hypothetical protein